MGMNVLCELDWTVHTAGDRSEAFHPKRPEALSMQVSEWWHQSSTLSETYPLSQDHYFLRNLTA